jgi:hypothetical protein
MIDEMGPSERQSPLQSKNIDVQVKSPEATLPTDADNQPRVHIPRRAEDEGESEGKGEMKLYLSIEAKEVERRMEELAKEVRERGMAVIFGLIIYKPPITFLQTVLIVKLLDIIIFFGKVTPLIRASGALTCLLFLGIYILTKVANRIDRRLLGLTISGLLLSLILLFAILWTYTETLDKTIFEVVEIIAFCLWMMQSGIWLAQIVYLFARLSKPMTLSDIASIKKTSKKSTNGVHGEAEVPNPNNNSHLMMSMDQTQHEEKAEVAIKKSEDSSNASSNNPSKTNLTDPASSERGSRKIKRRKQETTNEQSAPTVAQDTL